MAEVMGGPKSLQTNRWETKRALYLTTAKRCNFGIPALKRHTRDCCSEIPSLKKCLKTTWEKNNCCWPFKSTQAFKDFKTVSLTMKSKLKYWCQQRNSLFISSWSFSNTLAPIALSYLVWTIVPVSPRPRLYSSDQIEKQCLQHIAELL